MKVRFGAVLRFSLLIALMLGLDVGMYAAPPRGDAATGQSRLDNAYGRLSLHFEPNHGQVDDEVRFFTRGRGYALYLTANEAVTVLGEAVFRTKLVGADTKAPVEGLDPLRGKSNYFIGNDPANWQRNVPHYSKVRFAHVYPGIDLIYYGSHDYLEYDFIVKPGADPGRIRMKIEGANRLRIDDDGHLVLEARGKEARMRKPTIYQEVNGARREIRGRFRLKHGTPPTVSFHTAAYDKNRPLVIDPVLVYSTFLGGSVGENADSIAVDATGNAYVSGITGSLDFPRVNALQPTFGGGSFDGFVSKINAAGSALIYSTYLGGSGSFDEGYGLAVDSEGNVYVTGETNSTNFPTANPIQPTSGGGTDGFLAKISADGSSLIYSTYLGGSNSDLPFDLALDPANNAYVTGVTLSTDFPTINALQPDYGGGFEDAFVTKINAAGSALIYSTYLGGSEIEIGRGIAADAEGNAYVAGFTYSTDFPMMNPLQPGLLGSADAFVTKINAAGSALIYSTYLGGSSTELSSGIKLIAVNAAGDAHVTGSTFSTDFPTMNPLQAAWAGNIDAFVTKINADGSALVYSTYLGGTNGDDGYGIAIDAAGSAYVTGTTGSTDFPTVNAFQDTYGGTNGDAFVTKISADGSEMVYSSYLGGSGANTLDRGNDIAVDSAGGAYVTGQTYSADFPTVNPLQPVFGGAQDAFVTKISELLPPGEVADLSWSTKTTLEWSAVPGTVTYHVYRGVPPDLRKLLDTRIDSCLRLSTTEPSSGPVLTEVPAPRTFYWYLVRGENAAGLGPAGDATAGPRIHDPSGPCP